MQSTKYYGLFVWVQDDPVTGNVLSLCNIVDPRKPLSQYREKERVTAKCPGFGSQTGILGKISDEAGKKELEGILAGKRFKDVVASVLLPVPEFLAESTVDNDAEDVSVDSVSEVEENKGKRKNTETKNLATDNKRLKENEEAKQTKKDLAKKKREQESSRQSVMLDLSTQITSQSEPKPLTDQSTLDNVLSKVTTMANDLQTFQAGHFCLEAKVDALLEIANCGKCLRAKYKLIAGKDSQRPPSKRPLEFQTPKHDKPVTPVTPLTPLISLSPAHKDVSTTDLQELKNVEDDTDLNNESSKSGLVYLGESRYGVKVRREDLARVKICSKTIVKFALNSLEFLVSSEECKANLTVYGEGKGKNGMDENRRRALRSELFNNFDLSATEEEKTRIWMETVVPKLNNKIRGIRNDKYKLKD